MVEFDGRRYHGSGGGDAWAVAIDDLQPIGLASAANGSAWEDNTVFALSGVEPEDAIAMRYGSGATIMVLLAGEVTESLCPYMTSPEDEPTCGDAN